MTKIKSRILVLLVVLLFSGIRTRLNAQTTRVGVVDIADPARFTQVAAISDVHGELANLRRLLTNAGLVNDAGEWKAGRTLLVVIGDSIDKGPDSLGVLEFWEDLQRKAGANGGRVLVLLGNHEAEYLADPMAAKAKTLHKELAAHGLGVAGLADPKAKIDGHLVGAFLRQLPVAARVGRYLFCHAGWIPSPEALQPPSADLKKPTANWIAFTHQASAVLNAERYNDPFLIGPDSLLEKKTAHGALLPEDSDDSGQVGKWWGDANEVRELERRLDVYGLTGVVLGHQPTAFGLEGEVGAFRSGDYRLLKTDSGMAPQKKSDPTSARPGHLLLFTQPAELATVTGVRPEHVLSVGLETNATGGVIFTRHPAPTGMPDSH